MKNNKLVNYRKKIDNIDRVICKKIIERITIAKKIGEFKKENNLKISDENRENEILQKIVNDYTSDFKIDAKIIEDIQKIYKDIFKISKQNQK